jgi:hypothetical protein
MIHKAMKRRILHLILCLFLSGISANAETIISGAVITTITQPPAIEFTTTLNGTFRISIPTAYSSAVTSSDVIQIDWGTDKYEYDLATASSVIQQPVSGTTAVKIYAQPDILGGLTLNGMDVTSINFVAQQANLYYLQLNDNKFTSISNLSNLPALTDMFSTGGMLASLDVSGNPLLKILNVGDNSLSSGSLVLTEASLKELSVNDNPLGSLDLSGAYTALEVLEASNSSLTGITLSGATGLKKLNVASNQLQTLDAGATAVLTDLWANDNELTGITLNPAVTHLTTAKFENNRLHFGTFPRIDGGTFFPQASLSPGINGMIVDLSGYLVPITGTVPGTPGGNYTVTWKGYWDGFAEYGSQNWNDLGASSVSVSGGVYTFPLDAIGLVNPVFAEITNTAYPGGRALVTAEMYLGTYTSVSGAILEKTVSATRCYDLSGRMVPATAKGIVLEKTIYTDGSVKTVKRINR